MYKLNRTLSKAKSDRNINIPKHESFVLIKSTHTMITYAGTSFIEQHNIPS